MSEVKQTKNTGLLVGVLSEKNLRVEETTFKGDNNKEIKCKLVSGDITLETDNGVFKLRIYLRSKKADGSDNTMYKGIETIANTYVSKLDEAKDSSKTADVVSCQIKLGCNDYVPEGSKEVKVTTQISMMKANRVSGEYESSTDIDIEGVIRSIKPELNKDEKETGRLTVELVMIGYGGKAEPITLIVDEELASDFTDMYEVGNTCELYGEIIMKHIGGDNKKEASFGRKGKVSNGFDVMEISVIGGEAPYDEDSVDKDGNCKLVSIDTMKQLMNERNIYLENLVKNPKKKSETKTESKGMGVKKPLDDSEIPF